jgi:carbonic anhydrase
VSKPTSNDPTPLERLEVGNARFVSGYPIHPDETPQRIRDLKKGQHPFAVVVSCSDSRIPPELIFDQGLGDIFTIRTAGNVIGDYELGSIEYAVEHLHCKLVVVLGHESCGAIQAFLDRDGEKHGLKHHDHIEKILDYLANEKEEQTVRSRLASQPDLAVRANILHGVHLIQNSTPDLAPKIANRSLNVMGAYYDMDNGKVRFYDTLTLKAQINSNSAKKYGTLGKAIIFASSLI